MSKKLTTDPYKGVRDFYPDDMAVQRYMFDVWEQTAESFGYEKYDASVLEPSEIYKAKGAENEEMVNEQTYTFTDRGDREVTLRPEMTPTVARMIAGKNRELSFPVRWYSIPNLFRYERTQRGRLREHWQLNCDIFGSDDISADVEIIALAHQIFMNFGADESMFEIRLNNRKIYSRILTKLAEDNDSEITDLQIREVIRLSDKIDKVSKEEFNAVLKDTVGPKVGLAISEAVHTKGRVSEMIAELDEYNEITKVIDGLKDLGISNVKVDASLARGFDYYTGTIFEIFDTDPENNRSMMGGGRYDNLTEMFSNNAVSGVGFGFGDVTLKNFLENHALVTANITSPTLMIIPINPSLNMEGQKVAKLFRDAGISVATDLSDKKIAKKVGNASNALVDYVLVLGEDEISSEKYTIKNLAEVKETSGTIEDLIAKIQN